MYVLYFSLVFFSAFMFILGFLFDYLQKKFQREDESLSFNNSFSEIEILSENPD